MRTPLPTQRRSREPLAGPSRREGKPRRAVNFPSTSWSIVRAAAADNPILAAEALDRLCQAYRACIVCWFRGFGLERADAEDATQDFLVHVFGSGRLHGYTPQATRFRNWLGTCLERFNIDRWRRSRAARREPGQALANVADLEVPAPTPAPEAVLDRALARVMHAQALQALEQQWAVNGRSSSFPHLARFLLEPPAPGDYSRVGQALGLSPNRVAKRVFELREAWLDCFRTIVANSVEPTELADEVKYLASLLASETM